MRDTFDFFLSATDEATGYPADGNRLVQAWSWFSLNYPPYDPEKDFGSNGNLLAPDTGALLPLGKDFGDYIAGLAEPSNVALTFTQLQLTPPAVVLTSTVTQTLTLTATLANAGNQPACRVQVHLRESDERGNLTRLATRVVDLMPAQSSQTFTFTWAIENTSYGLHEVVIEATADNSKTGLPIQASRQPYRYWVSPEPFANFGYLPLVRE